MPNFAQNTPAAVSGEKKSKPETSALPILDRVLIWIEGGANRNARLVRGVGLAEGFLKQKAKAVHLVSPPGLDIEASSTRLNIQWQDINAAEGLTLKKRVQELKPDLVVLDSNNPQSAISSLQNIEPALALLTDEFSEDLLMADSVLLPGLIQQPDFESFKAPPSYVLRCIHGPQYIPLPQSYAQPLSPEAASIVMAVSPDHPLETWKQWIDAVLSWNLRSVSLLLEDCQDWEEAFSTQYPDLPRTDSKASFQQRLDCINSGRVIVASPGLIAYECLARGKALVLLDKAEPSYLSKTLIEQQAALSISTGTPNFLDQLKKKINDLLFNHELRKAMEQKAGETFSRKGGTKLAQEAIKRCFV